MTDAALKQALRLWGLADRPCQLIAERENRVYRIEAPQGPVALRLHRPGLRTLAELQSELDWMAALAAGGLTVPRPVPALDGRMVHTVGTIIADVLTWLPGAPMGRDGRLGAQDDLAGAYRELGGQMAQLHRLSDGWTPPQGFVRPAWDRDGLVGERPLWGRFWENPLLTAPQATLLRQARDRAGARLGALAQGADYGLIHADLVPENVLMAPDGPGLIDFDDGGHGFRLFDLATALNRTLRADDPAPLGRALLDGYRAARPIDLDALPLFQALRSFTYVGWIVPRLREAGAEARAARSIALACTMAERLLDEEPAEGGRQ